MKNHVFLVNLKPSTHRTAEETLGLQYLASALETQNYKVSIIDNWLDSSVTHTDVLEEILQNKGDLCFVGTSSYMASNAPTLDLIRSLKKEKIFVVSGGYGPTFEPELFLKVGSDIVCIGEGEETVVEIANYLTGNAKIKEKIKGICYLENGKLKFTKKRPKIHRLDMMPYPTRPFLDVLNRRKSTVNVLTSRGCMGNCSFCSISAFGNKQEGGRWRGRSLYDIVDELRILSDQGAETIKLIDDSFIENERDTQWCKEFANMLKSEGIKLKFRASIRAEKVNMENMRHLKRAGFFSFSCGIESGAESALRRMGKLASVSDNINAIRCFREYKYFIQSGFILFDNKTTIDELKANSLFLSENIDLITKGIFTEMFAAKSTEYTKSLENRSEKHIYSNLLYEVEDKKAWLVHKFLKKWQSNSIRVYDKVIDPISAPKTISFQQMKKYHKLMIKMKQADLAFMHELIRQVERSGDINGIYDYYLQKYSQFFDGCKVRVDQFYKEDGLNYDADENKLFV